MLTSGGITDTNFAARTRMLVLSPREHARRENMRTRTCCHCSREMLPLSRAVRAGAGHKARQTSLP